MLMEADNINIAVATHKNFYEKTLSILVSSLLQAGIKQEQIHIFCNGWDKDEIIEYSSLRMYCVNYNCYELTPLIVICEKKLKQDYWFLIHDTCKVGKDFKIKLYNFPSVNPLKIAMKPRASMSIGTYRYDYLLSKKDYIFQAKQYTGNKTWFVNNEDYVLWNFEKPDMYADKNNYHWKTLDNLNWYNTKTPRITEYHEALDLFKNKSNWGQSANYTSFL